MTVPLWRYDKILKATGARDAKGAGEGAVYGVSIDSREAAPGDLFIALSGETTDGHAFVDEAFKMGATLALVSRTPEGLARDDARLVWVRDTYQALVNLAKAARKRTPATIIAVTGTAGKTGSKDVLRKAFSMQGPAHAAVKSFNNHVGVPLSLARMPRDTQFGIFEVGMKAPGDIAHLSSLIRPHVALITTVGKAHLAAFQDEQDIALEKAAIFTGLEAGGSAVLNMDNGHFDLLKKQAKKYRVKNILAFSAVSSRADAYLLKSVEHADCSCLSAQVDSTTVTYKAAMPGRHWVINSLGILLAAKAAGGDLGLAGLALAGTTPRAGRGMVHEIQTGRGPIKVVDESYNANPSSLKAALEVFAKMKPAATRGRKIAILGDMEELGAGAIAEHINLAGDIRSAGVEVLYVRGAGMAALLKTLKPGISGFSFADNAGICRKLTQDLTKGDLFLVKGSRKAGLDEVVDHLRSLEILESSGGWGTPLAAAEQEMNRAV
jgi:UDP-N-acetylmuramoyl-tripeptide--D-alanyl-D-alanine ligase